MEIVQQHSKDHHKSSALLQSAGAGALIGVSFLVPFLWPLTILGIALCIRVILQTTYTRQALSYGYICGVTFSLCATGAYFWSVLPLDWFGIEDTLLQIILVGVLWVFVSAVAGISIALFAFFVRLSKTGTWYDLFLFPCLWVISEWLQAFILYTALLGEGSLFGPHITTNYVGYILADDSILIHVAWLGGVYALSFTAAFFGTLIVMCIQYRTNINNAYTKICVGCVVLFVFAHAIELLVLERTVETGGKTVSVSAIARYMPPTRKQDKTFQEKWNKEIVTLVDSLPPTDVLILPENTGYLRVFEEGRLAVQLPLYDGRVPFIVDTEDIKTDEGPIYSQVMFFNGRVSYGGRKQFLVPFGEYLPSALDPGLSLFDRSSSFTSIISDRSYVSGQNNFLIRDEDYVFGVRFCDEVMSPQLFREQVQDGTTMLVNVSSLSWFHGSPVVYEHMKRFAKVRAVESGRWFVQSGNMTPAFILDEHGNTVVETTWNVAEAAHADVPQKTHTTPYTALGPLSILSFIGGVLTRFVIFKR